MKRTKSKSTNKRRHRVGPTIKKAKAYNKKPISPDFRGEPTAEDWARYHEYSRHPFNLASGAVEYAPDPIFALIGGASSVGKALTKKAAKTIGKKIAKRNSKRIPISRLKQVGDEGGMRVLPEKETSRIVNYLHGNEPTARPGILRKVKFEAASKHNGMDFPAKFVTNGSRLEESAETLLKLSRLSGAIYGGKKGLDVARKHARKHKNGGKIKYMKSLPADFTIEHDSKLRHMPNKAFSDTVINGMKITYLDEYERLSKEKDSLINSESNAKNKGKIIKIDQDINDLYNYQYGIKRHAYGSKINPSLNAADYGGVALDTGSGILGGLATGATIGSLGGPIGTVGGAVIGGLIGLGKGIFGAKGKAEARARAKEANRQQTMANMDARENADLEFTTAPTATGFYEDGGMMRRHRYARGGMLPMSSDSQLAVGPSHSNGGIDVGGGNEIEGGEVLEQEADGTRVFSDRLMVPNSDLTFADASSMMLKRKGEYESKIETLTKSIEENKKESTKANNNVLKINSSKRRAQIDAMKIEELVQEIAKIDAGTEALFNIQQKMNGQSEGQEGINNTTEFEDGGLFKNPIGWQAGADAFDTMSQALTAYQMSKLPAPTQRLSRAPKLNSYVDNSEELATIDSNARSTRKFITNNARGAGVRRANVISMMNRVNSAKNASNMRKNNAERQIENQNKMISFQNEQFNNQVAYSNSINQFDSAIASNERYSQISANMADKVANIALAGAERERDDMSFAAILAKYPASVRRGIIKAMRSGKSMREALMDNVQ